MNYKLSLSLFLFVALFSCQSTPNQAEIDAQQALWEEVMAIHDEVMPKISEMNQISREFKKIEEKESDLFESYREPIIMSRERLEAAEEGMFSWMNEFQPLDKLRESKSHEEILAYLNGEKEKIAKVKDDMLNSLSGGIELLDKFETLSQQENAE